MEQLHQAGYKVHVWSLRSLSNVEQALELGAGGGTSDDPGAAIEWLALATRPRPPLSGALNTHRLNALCRDVGDAVDDNAEGPTPSGQSNTF